MNRDEEIAMIRSKQAGIQERSLGQFLSQNFFKALGILFLIGLVYGIYYSLEQLFV